MNIENPADILTLIDYETPRTPEEMRVWWRSKFELFGATKAGRAYAREGKGLTKKFHEEAQPMIEYMRRFPPPPETRCQLLGGNQEADCLFLSSTGTVMRRFQITTAIDGRTEKLRLRQLTRVGHVDGLAKLNADDEIPDDALPSDRYQLIQEMAGFVLDAIERKNAKKYPPGYTLIVGFDDNTFDGEGDPARFRATLGAPAHTFAELFAIGLHGNVTVPEPSIANTLHK